MLMDRHVTWSHWRRGGMINRSSRDVIRNLKFGGNLGISSSMILKRSRLKPSSKASITMTRHPGKWWAHDMAGARMSSANWFDMLMFTTTGFDAMTLLISDFKDGCCDVRSRATVLNNLSGLLRPTAPELKKNDVKRT